MWYWVLVEETEGYNTQKRKFSYIARKERKGMERNEEGEGKKMTSNCVFIWSTLVLFLLTYRQYSFVKEQI